MSTIRVGLILEAGNGYFRNVMRGVTRYAKPNKPWLIRNIIPGVEPIQPMADWRPDGLIVQINDMQAAESLKKLKVPVINVGGAVGDIGFPRVRVDDTAVGRLAAEYFLERGFQFFAFIGLSDIAYSAAREAGFKEVLSSAGFNYMSLHDAAAPSPEPAQGTWTTKDANIERWLRDLPNPCGVFVASDTQCFYIAELCHDARIHVPEELALLGVDNDELFCELAYPRLSSIRTPNIEIGYQAAALLDRMMSGKKAPSEPHLLPPTGVVTRQSSDVVALDDPDVSAAVRYIRSHASEQISVNDVLKQVQISRRSLEQKFRQALRRSPLAEISRVRIDRVKELLTLTNISMREVAVQAGFTNAERLSVVFKRKVGVTPTEFRERFRTAN